jgi:hypothetical protein
MSSATFPSSKKKKSRTISMANQANKTSRKKEADAKVKRDDVAEKIAAKSNAASILITEAEWTENDKADDGAIMTGYYSVMSFIKSMAPAVEKENLIIYLAISALSGSLQTPFARNLREGPAQLAVIHQKAKGVSVAGMIGCLILSFPDDQIPTALKQIKDMWKAETGGYSSIYNIYTDFGSNANNAALNTALAAKAVFSRDAKDKLRSQINLRVRKMAYTDTDSILGFMISGSSAVKKFLWNWTPRDTKNFIKWTVKQFHKLIVIAIVCEIFIFIYYFGSMRMEGKASFQAIIKLALWNVWFVIEYTIGTDHMIFWIPVVILLIILICCLSWMKVLEDMKDMMKLKASEVKSEISAARRNVAMFEESEAECQDLVVYGDNAESYREDDAEGSYTNAKGFETANDSRSVDSVSEISGHSGSFRGGNRRRHRGTPRRAWEHSYDNEADYNRRKRGQFGKPLMRNQRWDSSKEVFFD